MESLFMDWMHSAIENAPVIAVLTVVAWDMRRHLLACIDHNNALLDQLIRRYLGE